MQYNTQENIQLLTKIRWLSRVPVPIKERLKLVQEIDESDLNTSHIKGYSLGGVTKWLKSF